MKVHLSPGPVFGRHLLQSAQGQAAGDEISDESLHINESGTEKINEPEMTHRDRVEKKKLEEATSFLRNMIGKPKIVLGAGAGHRQESRRTTLDVWNELNGSKLNLSGHITEGRKSGLTIIVNHYSKKPVSFNGVPIVLTPNIKPGNERCDRSSTPIEILFEETDTPGEYRAYFTDLAQGNYTLRIGDPNLTVFGNPRKQ